MTGPISPNKPNKDEQPGPPFKKKTMDLSQVKFGLE